MPRGYKKVASKAKKPKKPVAEIERSISGGAVRGPIPDAGETIGANFEDGYGYRQKRLKKMRKKDKPLAKKRKAAKKGPANKRRI